MLYKGLGCGLISLNRQFLKIEFGSYIQKESSSCFDMLTLFDTLNHYNDLSMTESMKACKSLFKILWQKKQLMKYHLLSARDSISQVLDKDNCMTYL